MLRYAIVIALALVVVVSVGGAAAKKYCFSSPGTNNVELEYTFKIADANGDGSVTREEFDRFQSLQKQVVESNGELMINESGELEIADKFAHDEEARAEFEKRQHMKD